MTQTNKKFTPKQQKHRKYYRIELLLLVLVFEEKKFQKIFVRSLVHLNF